MWQGKEEQGVNTKGKKEQIKWSECERQRNEYNSECKEKGKKEQKEVNVKEKEGKKVNGKGQDRTKIQLM